MKGGGASGFSGSGIATMGGEAPVEQSPHEKYCVERDEPLCSSVMWRMLDSYYKQMAIAAWAHDYVPSFVTSNSRLCRSYAKVIINFLQDWFRRPEADPSKPVIILEIGGGHGRFTFLLLRALKRYEPLFQSLGLPPRPFLVVFSDVAEANVSFCSTHSSLKEFVDCGWLDFAVFDGNRDREVFLIARQQKHNTGSAPVIAICNYVLDSLLTDAWRVTPGASPEYERALVSIYSPVEEERRDAAEIMLRMTLGWKWRPVDLSGEGGAAEGVDYLQEDPKIREVLLRYRALDKQLSFVLPIGAFALFRNLLHIGGGRLLCLVGDKGYPTADEFAGHRDPHIAIHGSISFMLNLHAIRTYFECLGGFSHATPYRDTFQVTCLWRCGTEQEMGRSVAAFLEDVEDLAPEALINWQRAAQETRTAGGGPCTGIKPLISLLRYSGHDSDVLLNFSSEFTSQCVHPFLNPRTEHDLLRDLDHTFDNWYKLKSGEDIADVCGHICMRLGRCDKALKFLKASVERCPENAHPSTYVNLASCHKVEGNFEEGLRCCEKALELDPTFAQATLMQRTLRMCCQPVKVAVIGIGYWTLYEAFPLLQRDKRFCIAALFSFKSDEAEALAQRGELKGVQVYSGTQGFAQMLERDDIQAVIADVHPQLMASLLPRIFANKKHLLTRSPLHLSMKDGAALLDLYKPHCRSLAWHAVENARHEDAFVEAAHKLKTLGPVTSVALKCVTDTTLNYQFSVAPHDMKHHMALDLLRGVTALKQITGMQLSAVSATAVTDSGSYTAPDPSAGSPTPPAGGVKDQQAGQGPAGGPSGAKGARLRRDLTRLCGWLTFRDETNETPRDVLGSFVVTHCAGDNVLNYQINCLHGTMRLSKTSSCWRVEVFEEKAGSSTTTAYQSIGHQNCHDAFAEDLYNLLTLNQTKEAQQDEQGQQQLLVDLSVHAALGDCALIEGIIGSIQRHGASVRFGQPMSASWSPVKKDQKEHKRHGGELEASPRAVA